MTSSRVGAGQRRVSRGLYRANAPGPPVSPLYLPPPPVSLLSTPPPQLVSLLSTPTPPPQPPAPPVRRPWSPGRPLDDAGDELRPFAAGPDAEELAAWQRCLPPGGAFCHLTAAVLRGWWVPPLPDRWPVFAAVHGTDPRPRRDGLLVCRHPRPIAFEEVRGLRIATAAETLLAAARDLGLLDLVVMGDCALHLGHCSVADLRRATERRRRGAAALRRALPYLDRHSESAWESLLRMLRVLCGVPVQTQYPIVDDGSTLRADLRIRGTRRLPEYDGGVHRRPGRQAKDLARERRLQRLGWQRYGYTSDVLLYNAVSVLADADHALGREHDPSRVRAWHRELRESLFSASGTARLCAHWALQQRRQHRAAG